MYRASATCPHFESFSVWLAVALAILAFPTPLLVQFGYFGWPHVIATLGVFADFLLGIWVFFAVRKDYLIKHGPEIAVIRKEVNGIMSRAEQEGRRPKNEEVIREFDQSCKDYVNFVLNEIDKEERRGHS